MSIAIVTGASSGLGLELTLQLLSVDSKVVGVSRRRPNDERLLLHVQNGAYRHVQGDVAHPDTPDAAFGCADTLGTPDILINCAGAGIYGPVGSYTHDDVEQVLAGNLTGLILFCEAGYRRFRSSGGTIVNVMSTAAQVARANEAIYCAAKWGARGYTESLRLEVKGSPVRVVAVYPGGMNTPFWERGKGHSMDSSKFMDATEVATSILAAITDRRSAYVSDIVINRK